MERFSATVSIEELKTKAKNANTTKSTCVTSHFVITIALCNN